MLYSAAGLLSPSGRRVTGIYAQEPYIHTSDGKKIEIVSLSAHENLSYDTESYPGIHGASWSRNEDVVYFFDTSYLNASITRYHISAATAVCFGLIAAKEKEDVIAETIFMRHHNS